MMRFHLPSRRRLKKELSRRLIYHPLLRILLLKRWFRVVFLVLCGSMLVLPLYVSKLWTSSPAGYLPKVKVSGLDLTQGWSLKRSARRAEAAGNHDLASYTWQAAIANNLADAEAIRGFLGNLVKVQNVERRTKLIGMHQSLTLLKLTRTNQADVSMVAKLFDHWGAHELNQQMLQPLEEQLSVEAQICLLKAYFAQGQYQRFNALMGRVKPIEDPVLHLFVRAFEALHANGSEAEKALLELGEARGDQSRRGVATRLLLRIAAEKGDLAALEENLRELEVLNQSSASDHAIYWKALASAGRMSEARALAEQFTRSPLSGREAVTLAEAYYLVGLREESENLLRQCAPRYGMHPEVWVSYAGLLEESHNWGEMRRIAREIRQMPGVRETLEGYGFFLEGRAEWGEGRTLEAKRRFQEALSGKIAFSGLRLLMVNDLLALNFWEEAKSLLITLEEKLKSGREYWEACFAAALGLKDAQWMLKLASEALKESPEDQFFQNWYAAALIINRTRPEEALRYTFPLVSDFPESIAARVNHSAALLQNGRYTEAEVELRRLDPENLKFRERAAYYLTLFELEVGLGHLEQARAVAAKIDQSKLFPVEIEWLEQQLRRATDLGK